MVAKRAIFFSGIARGAGCEDRGILTVDHLLPLLLCLVLVLKIHVLAFDETTNGIAVGAFCPVEFQLKQWHIPPFYSLSRHSELTELA